MFHNILNSIWTWFSHHSHPLTSIRLVLFLLFVVLLTAAWLRARRRSKKRTDDEEMSIIVEKYSKNEAGKFPWEEDADDDPKRLKEDAKPISLDSIPQRGRWRT